MAPERYHSNVLEPVTSPRTPHGAAKPHGKGSSIACLRPSDFRLAPRKLPPGSRPPSAAAVRVRDRVRQVRGSFSERRRGAGVPSCRAGLVADAARTARGRARRGASLLVHCEVAQVSPPEVALLLRPVGGGSWRGLRRPRGPTTLPGCQSSAGLGTVSLNCNKSLGLSLLF